MKKAVLVLLLLAGVARGEVALPEQKITGAERPVPRGELVDLSVTPPGKVEGLVAVVYTWTVLDDGPGGLQVKKVRVAADGVFFGSGVKDKKLFVVCVVSYLFKVGDVHEVKTARLTAVVTVGDEQPGPVDPVGPQPVESALVKALRKAYSSEAGEDKAKLAASLAALYRAGAKAAGGAAVKTYGDLLADMSASAKDLGVSGKLLAVQAEAAAHLKKSGLPTTRDAAMTDDVRKLAAAKFLEVALALEELK